MSKTRTYCFTINNYTPAIEQLVQNYPHEYLIYGREVGASGTPHLQGYIRFANARSLRSVISDTALWGAHWEIAKGNPQQNIDYCSKEGNVYEHGTRYVRTFKRYLTADEDLILSIITATLQAFNTYRQRCSCGREVPNSMGASEEGRLRTAASSTDSTMGTHPPSLWSSGAPGSDGAGQPMDLGSERLWQELLCSQPPPGFLHQTDEQVVGRVRPRNSGLSGRSGPVPWQLDRILPEDMVRPLHLQSGVQGRNDDDPPFNVHCYESICDRRRFPEPDRDDPSPTASISSDSYGNFSPLFEF